MNTLRDENEVLKSLLKINNIGPYGEKPHGYFDPLQEAYKVINELKFKIAELEEFIRGQDYWIGQFSKQLETQMTNHGKVLEQIEVIEKDSKKFVLDKLQEYQDMNVRSLRKYSKLHKIKQAHPT